MNCPKCSQDTLGLWRYHDGDIKGLRCNICSYSIWSNEIVEQIDKVRYEAENRYLDNLTKLPADADELPPWLQNLYINLCTEEEREDLYKLATPEEIRLLKERGRIPRD